MVESVVYRNHLNETFEFGKNGVFVNESELHDFAWNITKKNNMIAAFDYAVSTRKFPVTIICASEAEGIARRNALFEVTEKDVLALEYGRLYIGDYYFKCYVQKSVKKNYLASKRYMTVSLTLATDCPYWVREMSTVFSTSIDLWERKAFFMSGSKAGQDTDSTNRIADLTYYSATEKEVKITPDSQVKYALFCYDAEKAFLGWGQWYTSANYALVEGAAFFRVEVAYTNDREITDDNIGALKAVVAVRDKATGNVSGGETGASYPHDYPFNYGSSTTAKVIVNPGFVASNFRLAVDGPCINPAVTIGGNLYQVNVTVASGEYLKIDSSAKTVTLYGSSGTQTNVFNSRNREAYIFEKIPAGTNAVVWSGDFNFEITLLEERSEPQWT